MAEFDANSCYSILERKVVLDGLGGLPETTVQNIAIKRGKKLYSHPRLLLPLPRASSRRQSS